ncbi:MAG TPA: amidohydrolase family protein, partial [Candidatus Nesterenkonia stercoripullorum]|nr:amidohydrolase family protein [Candidatus Nesterenkonia stercoripullorum]
MTRDESVNPTSAPTTAPAAIPEATAGATAEAAHEHITETAPEVIAGRDPASGGGLRLHLRAGMIDRIERCPAGELADEAPYLAPGLIDLQVNGYGGFDVNGEATSVEGIVAITQRLASEGITTWIPTVITASEEMICRSLALVAKAKAKHPDVDAAVPFAHVEGPFLSALDGPRGVHDPRHIRPVDAAEVARWAEAGPVGYVTVSPHWERSAIEISRIVAGGVAVSLGHTHAGPEQILAAVDAGATLSTHLGNGIFAELPRHPNALWTQLADDRLTCGLIADGHHLPADTLRVMLRCLGGDRAVLVSDSVELAGAAPGRYQTAVGGTVELSDAGRLSYAGT